MKFTILRFIGIAMTALVIAAPWGIASAADMPLKAAAPVVAPEYNWSGFYGGVNAGWASERFNWTESEGRGGSRLRIRYLGDSPVSRRLRWVSKRRWIAPTALRVISRN